MPTRSDVSEPATTAPSLPRARRLEPDARREQILTCAVRLFGERPYAAVSTTDLAAAAGVTRGLLHHYFGTKRDLYLEVVREMLFLPGIDEAVTATGPLQARVERSVDWFLDTIGAHGATFVAVSGAEGVGGDPEIEAMLAEADDLAARKVLEIVGVTAATAASAASGAERAVVRAYASLVKGAVREWVRARTLTRDDVRLLMTQTLVAIVEDVMPQLSTSAASGAHPCERQTAEPQTAGAQVAEPAAAPAAARKSERGGVPEAVLWDADGVLQHTPPGWRERLVELGGPDFPDAVMEAEQGPLVGLCSFRDALDAVVREREFARSAQPVDIDAVLDLWRAVEIDQEALALVDEVRAGGTPCYLASNQQDLRVEIMRHELGYADHVDAEFYSSELGVMKPDPAYFERVLEAVDLPAAQLLFIDDNAENVEAARSVGLRAERHDPEAGAVGLAAILRRYGLSR